jgi:uncharacterized Fe-S cluster-containing radical SAM superfamily protein
MDGPEIRFRSGWGPAEACGDVSVRRMDRKAVCVLEGIRSPARLLIVGRLQNPEAGNMKLRVSTGSGLLGEGAVTSRSQACDFPVKGRPGGLEVHFELAGAGPPSSTGGDDGPGMIVERIQILTGKAAGLPSVLEIESSTRCNINPPCVMCYPRIFDKRRYFGDIDEAAFSKLVPYLKGFRTISLHGVGEPLLGGKLAAILDNIDRERTWVQFNSNGLLLTEDMSRELIRKGLKMIDFSLDAATPETYRKIRRSDFRRVIRNIERLSEIKREQGTRYPVIMVNMTLMKENAPEVVSFVGLAERLGAEIVHLGLLNPGRDYRVESGGFVFDYREQMIDTGSAAFRADLEAARQKAAEFGIELVTEFSGYSP